MEWIDEREDHLTTKPEVYIDCCACVPELPLRPLVEENAVPEVQTCFITERDDLFTLHPGEVLDRQR